MQKTHTTYINILHIKFSIALAIWEGRIKQQVKEDAAWTDCAPSTEIIQQCLVEYFINIEAENALYLLEMHESVGVKKATLTLQGSAASYMAIDAPMWKEAD